MTRAARAAFLLMAGLVAGSAGAAEIEGVRFAERLSLPDTELRLQGVGLLRYRVIIKAYVAAFYLPESFDGEATPEAVLGDLPRRLEIEYFWALPARAFAEATTKGIGRNSEPASLERLRERIERFNRFYEDVEPGDRYALTYLPGVGTELSRNGRPLGTVEGADFSSALFAIWLGDEALDASLRSQLLARR